VGARGRQRVEQRGPAVPSRAQDFAAPSARLGYGSSMVRVALLTGLVCAACSGLAGRPAALPHGAPPRASSPNPHAVIAAGALSTDEAQPKLTVSALASLWTGPGTTLGSLGPPARFTLPQPIEVVDVAAESGARAWVLGWRAALYRLEGDSVVLEYENNALCGGGSRPKHGPKGGPQTSPVDERFGHGLWVTRDGVKILLSKPGAMANVSFAALRDRQGEVRCELPPYLVIGGKFFVQVRAGGRLWAMTYSGLRPLLPDQAATVPQHPEAWSGVWVPVQMHRSAPMFWGDESTAPSRFNGLRWERMALPELAELRRDSAVVDDAGILWGVAEPESGGEALLVAYDGKAWRAGRVPGVEHLQFVSPVNADRAWLVGANAVAYRLGQRFYEFSVAIGTQFGAKVDDRGRLWVWTVSDAGVQVDDSLSDSLSRFDPPSEAT
jgi:hypothetical protein